MKDLAIQLEPGITLQNSGGISPVIPSFTDPTGESAGVAVLGTGVLILGVFIVSMNSSSRPGGLSGQLESAWDKYCEGKNDPCKELVGDWADGQ